MKVQKNNLSALERHLSDTHSASFESTKPSQDFRKKIELKDLKTDAFAAKTENRIITASIIVNLDGIQNRVKENIVSIQEHTPEVHEILFIDHAATKGIIKWGQRLVEENQNYHLLKCDKDMDWGSCLNMAVQKASSGEYVVLMHNDLVVAEGWLEGMLQCFKQGSHIGAVGPMSNRTAGIQQMIHSDGSDRVEFESAATAFYEQNQYRRVTTQKTIRFLFGFPT